MANTFTQIHLQPVFAVKHRQALIQKSWRERLHVYITGIIQNYGHKVLQINSRPDHIHILIGYRPSQPLPKLVEEIKTASNLFINDNKLSPFQFAWQIGYAAFSAIADYNQVVRIEPNNGTAYGLRGNAKYSLGDERGAITDYDLVIRFDPNNVTAYINRGNSHLEIGDRKRAIADFDQAIRINPKYVLAYNNRGGHHQLLGNFHDALLDFNCFLSLTDKTSFSQNVKILFSFYHIRPAPYLLHRTLEKFTNGFKYFNTIHPIRRCHPTAV